MKRSSVLARLLFAAEPGGTAVEEILGKAKTKDKNSLRLLIQADLLEPVAADRLRLTPAGEQRRLLYQ